jgi:hypothetical protein
MTATQMGATALAAGASALGYTNVPVISDIQPLKPSPFPPMATTEIGYPLEKLTIDPKNELTLDPHVVGLDSTDELNIQYLVGKESYITKFNWDTTIPSDQLMFTNLVSPIQFYTSASTNSPIYMTPICWIAQMFEYWRGDIIFRFRFVASPFHKGRVRISYDPSGTTANNLTNDSISSTVVFTQIVDLGKDSDVEIRVPFNQAFSWLRHGRPTVGTVPFSNSTSPGFNYDPLQHNGTITVRCLTTLTAPVTTSSIDVLVFVRGADNLEFNNTHFGLSDQFATYSYFKPQSDDTLVPQHIVAGNINPKVDERYLINNGEKIVTLRQVLRRSSLSAIRPVQISGSNLNGALWQHYMSRYPPTMGYDPSGINTATGIITPFVPGLPFNWVFFHPIPYIMCAFVGNRGAINWSFNLDGTISNSMRVYRYPLYGVTTQFVQTIAPNATSDSTYQKSIYLNTWSGSGGQILTNGVTNAGMNVSLPNYNIYKFSSCNATLLQSTSDGASRDGVIAEISIPAGTLNRQVSVQEYAAIGTDFNVHFFLNVPTLYLYSTLPPAT